jgi:predicted TIM-barrel fold metal-dependent hydrolase
MDVEGLERCALPWLLEGTQLPLPPVGDAEGARLPESLPPVVDAHVHLFPERMFEAIWAWFEEYGWPIRYRLHTEQLLAFLFERGVQRVVALHYAHKAGIARALNRYVAEICAREPRVWGLATVFPGEPDATGILEEAFAAGLRGVKLHCHVQCFSPDADALDEVYRVCAAYGRPLVMHAGREPASPHYACDPHALCGVDRIERVLKAHPRLKLCVPHLGADEYSGYERLLERHDGLWLDTTMVLADYFPSTPPRRLLTVRPERILYGTDFPNLPYAWDREIKKIAALRLGDQAEAAILGANATALFGP